MLTILSHLLKGESIIEKYLQDKEKEMPKVASTTSKQIVVVNVPTATERTLTPPTAQLTNSLSEEPNAHSQFLDILVDMGFTRELSVDALAQTGYDVEQAAEWLLVNSNIVARPPVSCLCLMSIYFY